jgi:hypothetical protein
MKPISARELNQARTRLCRLNDGRKLRNDGDACRFIEERGFILLMPINGLPLPSLSAADDAASWPGFAITDRAWAWKERLPEQKLCAYTKLIHGRGTFISWRLYPYLLRIHGLDGDPEHEYECGRLARADRDLYRIVAEKGPLDSRALWIQAKPLFDGKRSRFTAALERLQLCFILTVCGGSLAGWSRHNWDLVERQAPPDAIKRLPSLDQAQVVILLQTITNGYALSGKELQTILRWPLQVVEAILTKLIAEKAIVAVSVANRKELCYQIFSAETE